MASDIEKLEVALYVVATPIGNLKDITLRALDVLKRVDVIAAEDTRNTSVLLDKYSISTRLVSYHKFSESKKADFFVELLKEGKSVALVSDAGTPLISDPGSVLVENVLNNGFKVIPITGACAITTLLSAIPREYENFKFIGFLPRVRNQIAEIILKNKNENLVFYESPNRVLSTLETIEETLPNSKIAFGRELTKKFEEIRVDYVKNIIDDFKKIPPKGEFALLLYKNMNDKNEIDIVEKVKKLKALNLKDKEIAKILASLFEVNKNDVYRACLEYE